jgi:GDP-4-dehydro-6-deoxy-D-mannose reductase
MTVSAGETADRPLPYLRVFVTGGTGFVGRHLVYHLRRRLPPTAMLAVGGRGEEGSDIAFDLSDPASIRAAISETRPDLVVHLAGEASVASATATASRAWRLNVGGTMALAEAIAAESPDCTVLFASSSEVYGEVFLEGAAKESDRPKPNAVYAQSKLAAEQSLAVMLPPQARLFIARPSNHIGPGQAEHFAISSFAHQLVERERVAEAAAIRVGNLEAQRDFLDVRDVVRAYDALLALPVAPAVREIFNISLGKVHTIRFVLDELRSSARVASEVVVDPLRYRASEIQVAMVDSSKLRAQTGWQPAIPIEHSVRDVLDDWRRRL